MANNNSRISVLMELREGAAVLMEGLGIDPDFAPVPMAGKAPSVVVRASLNPGDVARLMALPEVIDVWADSPIVLQSANVNESCTCSASRKADCAARQLGVDQIWAGGHRGEGVVVGMVGGDMRAAVLAMAPEARILDLPLAGWTLGDVLQTYQGAITRFRKTGTPQVMTNAWRLVDGGDEANHPLARKVDEAVALGMTVVFEAEGLGSRGALVAVNDGFQGGFGVPMLAADATLAGICALLTQAQGGLHPDAIRGALEATLKVGMIRPWLAHEALLRGEDKALAGQDDPWAQDNTPPYPQDAPQPYVRLVHPEARAFEDMVSGQLPAQEPMVDLLSRIRAAQAVLDHLVAQHQALGARLPSPMSRT